MEQRYPLDLPATPTPPVAPSGCEEALVRAAELWLETHGAPSSYALGDAHFTMLAERVLWATARQLGMLADRGDQP